MDNEQKLNINLHTDKAGHAVLLQGGHFLDLKDESKQTMQTNKMDAFIAFVKTIKEKFNIFYGENKCSAHPQTVEHSTKPFAVCELGNTIALNKLIRAVNGRIQLDEMENFLLYMRPFMDENARFVFDHCRDLKISKVTEINRKKDRRGNYTFSIKRESAGNSEFEPPEKIGFNIPLFNHIDAKGRYEFVLEFDYKTSEEIVSIYFQMINPQFKEELARDMENTMITILNDIDNPKYWGKVEVFRQTDNWSRLNTA